MMHTVVDDSNKKWVHKVTEAWQFNLEHTHVYSQFLIFCNPSRLYLTYIISLWAILSVYYLNLFKVSNSAPREIKSILIKTLVI